jgi:predicted amidohydrolase
MSDPFTVACVQNCAGADMDVNLAQAETLVRQAGDKGADLICLPEYFSYLDLGPGGELGIGSAKESNHPALPQFQGLAEELGAWIVLGSLAIDDGAGRSFNRSFVIDSKGHIVARYDKMHLFDVDLKSGENYRESDTIRPGSEPVLAPTPWGLLGLTLCYDLRFPYLYRALAEAGAGFLAVPSAFTRTTGEAHWHVLLRARAIETGCFVFAPDQAGVHGKGRSYGHSLIVDPWGQILADGGENVGLITAEIDPAGIERARRRIPSLTHDRDFSGPEAATVKGARSRSGPG